MIPKTGGHGQGAKAKDAIGMAVFASSSRNTTTPSLVRAHNTRPLPPPFNPDSCPPGTLSAASDNDSDTESDFCPLGINDRPPCIETPSTPSAADQPLPPAIPGLPFPPPSPATPIFHPSRAPHGYSQAFAPLFAYTADSRELLSHPVARNVAGLTNAQVRQLEGEDGEDEEEGEKAEGEGTRAQRSSDEEGKKRRECRLASPFKEVRGVEDGAWDGKEIRWEMPEPASPLQSAPPLPSTLYGEPYLDSLIASAAQRLETYDTTRSRDYSDPAALTSSSSAQISDTSKFEYISSDPLTSSSTGEECHVSSMSLPLSFTLRSHANLDATLHISLPPSPTGHDQSAPSPRISAQGSFTSIDSWRPAQLGPSRGVSGHLLPIPSSDNVARPSARSLSADTKYDATPRTARKLDSIDAVYRAIRQGSNGYNDHDESDAEQEDDDMSSSRFGSKMNNLLAHMTQSDKPDVSIVAPNAIANAYHQASSDAHRSSLQYTLTVPPPRPIQFSETRSTAPQPTIKYPNIAKYLRSSSPMDDSDSDSEDEGSVDGMEDDVVSSPSIRRPSPAIEPSAVVKPDSQEGRVIIVEASEEEDESGSDSDDDVPLALRRTAQVHKGNLQRGQKQTISQRRGSSQSGNDEKEIEAPQAVQVGSASTLGPVGVFKLAQRWSTRLAKTSQTAKTVAVASKPPAATAAASQAPTTAPDSDGVSSDSDSGSTYAQPSFKDQHIPSPGDESGSDTNDSDADDYLPPRGTKRAKQSAAKLKRKAGQSNLKIGQAAGGSGERKREPDCVAKMESLRNRLMGIMGGSQGSNGGGGVYRGFDVRLCMLMVDERFQGVIKWDKAGEAMVIDDFQLFWSMACKFVMRKETQQSAFDKQLSNHGFTRQTEKSQSRKTIAHVRIRRDDAELWEAVKAQPRLEPFEEKKTYQGSPKKAKSKSTTARARKAVPALRAETSLNLASDVLQSENTDLETEIQEKDEMIERLRAALGLMGVHNDESALTNLGLLASDLPAQPIPSGGEKNSRVSTGPVTASARKTRLSKVNAAWTGLSYKAGASPTSPRIKGQASSWSIQTLVEPSPSSLVGTGLKGERAPEAKGAGTVPAAQSQLVLGTAIEATPLNTQKENHTALAAPDTHLAPAELVKVGRKRKSTAQLAPGPPDSPSPCARRPVHGSTMLRRDALVAKPGPGQARNKENQARPVPGPGYTGARLARRVSGVGKAGRYAHTASSGPHEPTDSRSPNSPARSAPLAAPDTLDLRESDTISTRGRTAFPTRAISKVPRGRQVAMPDTVAIGAAAAQVSADANGQTGGELLGPKRKRSRLTKA